MSEVSVSELSNKLRDAITQLDLTEGLDETGVVVRVGDGCRQGRVETAHHRSRPFLGVVEDSDHKL